MYIIDISGKESRIEFQSAHMIPDSEQCSHLHGHSYTIDAKISGEVEGSMLVDFALLKNSLRDIAALFDHRMIIPEGDGRFTIGEKSVRAVVNGREYLFPVEDCFVLKREACTAELLAEFIHGELLKRMFELKGFEVVIGISEGLGSRAWYKEP